MTQAGHLNELTCRATCHLHDDQWCDVALSALLLRYEQVSECLLGDELIDALAPHDYFAPLQPHELHPVPHDVVKLTALLLQTQRLHGGELPLCGLRALHGEQLTRLLAFLCHHLHRQNGLSSVCLT